MKHFAPILPMLVLLLATGTLIAADPVEAPALQVQATPAAAQPAPPPAENQPPWEADQLRLLNRAIAREELATRHRNQLQLMIDRASNKAGLELCQWWYLLKQVNHFQEEFQDCVSCLRPNHPTAVLAESSQRVRDAFEALILPLSRNSAHLAARTVASKQINELSVILTHLLLNRQLPPEQAAAQLADPTYQAMLGSILEQCEEAVDYAAWAIQS